MSTVRRSELTTSQSSASLLVSLAVLAVAVLAFGGSWLVIFQQVDETATIFGIAVLKLLGFALVVVAFGLVGLGLASRFGYVQTTPSSTAGFTVTIVAGTLWSILGSVLVVQRFEPATTVWLPAALLFGVGGGLAAAVPREDVGSTVSLGLALAFVGATIGSGRITADSVWSPAWVSAVFPGSELIPMLVAAGSVLAIWSVATAKNGFGAVGRQAGAFYLIRTVVFGMLAVLVLLVGFVVVNGLEAVLTGASVAGGRLAIPVAGVTVPWLELPFLTNVTGGLFVEIPGVLPAIVGTLWLVFGAVVFALPLGVGAAVFLTEYAERGRFTQVIEVATNGLWSTPSIVFGLFGLAFLVPRISGGNSILVGQLVLGFMLLPLVLITSREAIKAVPDEHRDASAALGATKWQTIRSVVLPSATPGIITGVILGVGRIAGETAPLLFVFGGAPYPNAAPNVLGSFEFTGHPPFVTNEALLSPASALPYQLYSTITAGVFPKEAFTNTEFGWGTALVLLLIVIGLYAIGVGSRLYFRHKLHRR